MKRIRMRHPSLPDREIVAYPKPGRLAAGWEPVPEADNDHTSAGPVQPLQTTTAAPAETTEANRRRRGSREQEQS